MGLILGMSPKAPLAGYGMFVATRQSVYRPRVGFVAVPKTAAGTLGHHQERLSCFPSISFPITTSRRCYSSSRPTTAINATNATNDNNDNNDNDVPNRRATTTTPSTTMTNMVETTARRRTSAKAVDLDWDDRIGLQDRFTLEEKGWQVDVDWRSTPLFGSGIFAKQAIPEGTVLRTGRLDVNLKEFCSIREIDDFCRLGDDVDDDDDDADVNAGVNAVVNTEDDNDIFSKQHEGRRNYVKDYLWGFNKRADSSGGGYDLPDVPPERFFGMWIPGNGLNHHTEPNTVYRPTPNGIDLVALVDIAPDEELFDDYRRHGPAPEWLKAFARRDNVTLNFADCNAFV